MGVLASNDRWATHLAGEFEVPVAVDTRAQGQATFKLSDDGMVLHYKLNVANIENVFMAHIHAGPATSTGPIVVWLYPSTPNPALASATGFMAAGADKRHAGRKVRSGQPTLKGTVGWQVLG